MHVINIITIKIFTLFKKYRDYVNIFFKDKMIKFLKLKDTEHLINLKLKVKLFHELIYNLFI